jgi:uncharacterized protein YndB with AHSA1/START domain
MKYLQILVLFSIAGIAAIAAPQLKAEVIESSAAGFLSQHSLQIDASPKKVYAALTRDIHRWWDANHSYSGKARNFTLDARAGGCFCERLAGGGSVEHMRVVFANKNKELRLAGGLGPLQTMAVTGSMVFVLEPHQGGTRLSYSYRVAGTTHSKLDALAGPVDAVQLGQLQRLQKYLESRR